uniref:NADH:ubiquinone reductase (H(+)-translocating) n=1 Tax=Psephenothrips eriobotryae TaxID=2913602 RepID=A0A9E7CBZ7_9NEOP|nr:NADH dehydrogenase subunit 5 [Psephenothrips eriobotryae]
MNKKNMMITFFLILISLSFLSFFFFLYMLKYKIMYFMMWEIIILSSNYMHMIFYLDWMSFSFLSVVFFISSMVSLYSMEYIPQKKNQFINLIFLFVISMMMLILSLNIMSILIGWDGLGLVSYILIIFFQSDKSKNSGMLTLMLNRIGDVLIIFSSWILFMKGGMNFLFYYNISYNFIIMFIIICAMTKSAQIPFSSWLPVAMAAPTPVSSLVHSSTLVTAGIYLMIRFYNYFNHFFFMKFILIMSTLTMFMAGMAANYEMDLKKIIALSTLSQLGLMMMTLSMNFIMLSFFHLITHALFKALLFLCSGIMLHSMKNNQDIRFMGLMSKYMPYTIISFNVANLSLCGFLFLSGFFSKDLIIENYLLNDNNLTIFFFLLVSTSLTVSYTFRLIYHLSFFNMNNIIIMKMKENFIFNMVLMVMTLLSMIMGSMYNWSFHMIFYEPTMSLYMKYIIPFIIFMGLNMSMFFLYKKNTFFYSMWFLNYSIVNLKNIQLFLTSNIFNSSNFGIFELIGSQGIYKYILMLSKINTSQFLINFKTLTLLSIFVYNLLNYL